MSNARQPAFRSASWNQPPSHVSRIPQTPHSLPQRPVSESFSLAGRRRTNDTTPARSSPLSNILIPDTTSDDGLDVVMNEPDGSVFNSSSPSTPLTRFARNLKNAGQQSPVRHNLLERRHSMQVSANRQRVINNFYNSTGHTPPSYHQPNPITPPTVDPSLSSPLTQNTRFTTSRHHQPRPAASPRNRYASSPHAPQAGFLNNEAAFSSNTNNQSPTPSPAHPSTSSTSITRGPPHQQHLRPIQLTTQQLHHRQQALLQHQHQQAQTFAQAQQAREQKIQEEFRKAQSLQLPPPALYICNLCDLQFTKSIECIEPDGLGRAYCEECIIKCAMRVVNEQKARVAEEEWAETVVNGAGAGVEMPEEMLNSGEHDMPAMVQGVGVGKGEDAELRADFDGQGTDGDLRVDVGEHNSDGELHAEAGGQGTDAGNVQTIVPPVAGTASPGVDTWTGVDGFEDFGFDYDAYFSGSASVPGSG